MEHPNKPKAYLFQGYEFVQELDLDKHPLVSEARRLRNIEAI